jgi:16S rRNA processing protein RimM
MKTQYLLIGEILKPQGIKGEVKLRAESEDMSRYEKLTDIYFKNGNQYERHHVLKGRTNGGFAFLQIQGISDREAAEALRGQMIYIDRKDAITLEEGRHFIYDLIGCEAFDQNGKHIGVLTDVQKPNSFCDVYVFKTMKGEMMMPALGRAIRKVDTDAGQIILDAGVLEEIAVWPDSIEVRDD